MDTADKRGRVSDRFADPVALFRVLRARIEAADTVGALEALRQHNGDTLSQLRQALPTLRNERGLHCVDLIEGLIVQ